MTYCHKLQMAKCKGAWALCLLILAVFHSSFAEVCSAQQIEARINRVGLFAGAEPAVRSGAWTFVDVGLRYRGDVPFDGELRVDQLDQDGDVATSILPVALAPGAEWRDYQVYYVPHDVNDTGNRVSVTLHDAKGRLVELVNETGATVKELMGPAVTDIPPDDLLIIDLTVPRKLAHISWLDEGRRRLSGYINAHRVRAMSPQELPQRWQGLEAVDAIVWDDADPSGLSPQQIDALLDWVHAGGRLLITSGKNWQALASSPLGAALPVTIKGTQNVNEALEFLDIVRNEEYAARLAKVYAKKSINRAVMDPRPGSIPIPADCPNQQIAYRRMLGRGVLTFVGAPLRELLPEPAKLLQPDAPFENLEDTEDVFIHVACDSIVAKRLLGLPKPEEDKNQANQFRPLNNSHDLFRIIRNTIAFESVGASFLVFAILFAIIYTVTATWWCNWFLRRRSWQHHGWTAFAMVSIAGSVVGFGMVWLLRGVTTRLWQTSVVDAQAANDEAEAICLFGVRTPDHTRLNLQLPVGPVDQEARPTGPIRVLPESDSLMDASSKYVDPENYHSAIAGTKLFDIPVRATLKEFQGHWHGPLNGTFDGKLIAIPNKGVDKAGVPYEFGEGSYLRNNLNVGLQKCYLFETEEEMAGDSPGALGLTKCWFVGDLAKGQQLQGEELRNRLFYLPDSSDPSVPPKRIQKMPLISAEIKSWANQLPLPGLRNSDDPGARQLEADQEYYSLLLLSFFDLIRHDNLTNMSIRRGHGRTMDCTKQLTKKTAILVGYSKDPAPAMLEANLVGLRPNKARTLYRFVIPVERPEKPVE